MLQRPPLHLYTNARKSEHTLGCHTIPTTEHSPSMSATKEFTYSDVSEHTSKKDLYLVIHDKVYNSSSFVDEHPYVLLFFLCRKASSLR